MDKLLEIINKLSEKYKFDESEVKEIQDAVFELENERDDKSEMEVEDFQTPEGFEVELDDRDEED